MKSDTLAPEFERRLAELELSLVIARHQANEERRRKGDLIALLREAEQAVYYKSHMNLVERIRAAIREEESQCLTT